MAFVYGLPLGYVPSYASKRAKFFKVGVMAVVCLRSICSTFYCASPMPVLMQSLLSSLIQA